MRGRIAVAALAVLASLTLAGPAGAVTTELYLPFDANPLKPGTRVVDVSGNGNHGTVQTAVGGAITPAGSYETSTTSARFPQPCEAYPCAKAIIEVPHDASLNPGYADISWGTRMRLAPHFTTPGQNVLQKGLWGDPGGQWKLQVDGKAGRPSCVVSGQQPGGGYRVVTVKSSVSVADGEWHMVVCRRTGERVTLVIDGTLRGQEPMPPVALASTAPITIGGKYLERGSDQFHGLLDDVFVRIG